MRRRIDAHVHITGSETLLPKQMIAMFKKSGIFTEEELDRVFYENAHEVYR